MPFVLDASISASWALADEPSLIAEAAQDRLRDDYALVPHIWWYEIRNLLVVNERRQCLTAENSATFLRLVSSYPIRIEPAEDEHQIFEIARRHRLSFYDAAYLGIAARHRVPLATLDRELRSAAIAAAVTLLS